MSCCLLDEVRLPVGFMTQEFFCEKFVVRRGRIGHPIQWKFNIEAVQFGAFLHLGSLCKMSMSLRGSPFCKRNNDPDKCVTRDA